MKKVLALLTTAFFVIYMNAQSPQKMSYQCVIRNGSGELVKNRTIGVKISILSKSATGAVLFSETYTPNPQTNTNGLLSLEIGSGISTSGTFSAINWADGPYFLKTEADPNGGSNYTIVGTTQLLSVPYALHAESVTAYDEADPVFGSSSAKSITNNHLENWNKAYGWGNHAGLYKPAAYAPDWSEIKTKPASVKGYGITDAVTVSGEQTITGLKSFTEDLRINGHTIGLGNGAVKSNIAFGVAALYSNTTGDINVAIGNGALKSNTTGLGNLAIGALALNSNTSGRVNTAVGYNALGSNTTGLGNVAIGQGSLSNNITGCDNTIIGVAAGAFNKTGHGNVFIGNRAGYWEEGSFKLYIDGYSRNYEAAAKNSSLIYGEFDADPANQVLTVNGHLNALSLNGISFFIKDGNNGTVSGDTYCRGSEWGRVGACIAVKRIDTGEYIPIFTIINTPVSCLCASF